MIFDIITPGLLFADQTFEIGLYSLKQRFSNGASLRLQACKSFDSSSNHPKLFSTSAPQPCF